MKQSEIIKKDGQWQWFVDGNSFVAYAGELHNSSASNLKHMDEYVWPYIKDLKINTILFPVYWETIEKEKGIYDFSLLDGIVEKCRELNRKAIILWFGLWKNATSTYVPKWVKLDTEKYFRAEERHGRKTATISPLCEKAIDADRKAFSKLMEQIKAINESETTVIAVQIENEIGLLNSDRDYSDFAEKIFKNEVSDELKRVFDISEKGNYEQLFGEDAPEVFMTYAYALAIEKIANFGKKIYDLPFLVNAWIEKYPWRPGTYPSGGPIAKYMNLWKSVAGSIDVIEPDVYVAEFDEVATKFSVENNPLMIPEYRRDVYHISNAFHAYGKYNALCMSVFGIEDLMTPPERRLGIFNPAVLATLNINLEAWQINGTTDVLNEIFELLVNSQNIREKARKEGKVYSFARINEMEKGTVIETEKYSFQIVYNPVNKDKPKSAGMIIELSEDNFYIMGTSFKVVYLPKKGKDYNIGILDYEEGYFENNSWICERLLNGDEGVFIQFFDHPEVKRLELYTY